MLAASPQMLLLLLQRDRWTVGQMANTRPMLYAFCTMDAGSVTKRNRVLMRRRGVKIVCEYNDLKGKNGDFDSSSFHGLYL